MLFNTPETINLLRLLNQRFDARGLATLILDDHAGGGNWQRDFGGLQGNTYRVAQRLGIDFDVGTGGASPLAKRWKKWCDYIDGHNDNNHAAGNIANAIGQAIRGVISGANAVTQIEFFAVPDSGANAPGNSVGVSINTFTDQNGQQSLVITVNTQTVDNLR